MQISLLQAGSIMTPLFTILEGLVADKCFFFSNELEHMRSHKTWAWAHHMWNVELLHVWCWPVSQKLRVRGGVAGGEAQPGWLVPGEVDSCQLRM